MSTGFGDITKDNILKFYTQSPASNPFATVPTVLYLALSTTAVAGTGTGTAPSTITEPPAANGYARIAIPCGTSGFSPITSTTPTGGSAATMRQVSIISQQIFGPASGIAWATIVAIALMDSATVGGGNVLFVGTDVTANTGVGVGSTFQVPMNTGFSIGIFSI